MIPQPARLRISRVNPASRTSPSGSRRRWSAWNRTEIGSRPLPEPDHGVWAAHVLEQQQSPTGPQDSFPLSHSPRHLGNGAEHKAEYDGVESLIREGHRLSVALDQCHRAIQRSGPPSGLSQHGRAQVQAGDLDFLAIQRNVEPGPNPHLQRGAACPSGHPSASPVEHQPIPHPDGFGRTTRRASRSSDGCLPDRELSSSSSWPPIDLGEEPGWRWQPPAERGPSFHDPHEPTAQRRTGIASIQLREVG